MPFIFTSLEIPDLILIEAKRFADQRGFFAEAYKQSEFAEHGISEVFVQDNYSCSSQGVLRGLHFQKHPAAQGKLIFSLRGEIFDVAVDIRKGSPTYGRWVATVLSEENHQILYVPEGFAHGFCVLSEEADVLYKTTREYSPEDERGIIWNDSSLAIKWPIENPLLSTQDSRHPTFKEADNNFTYRG